MTKTAQRASARPEATIKRSDPGSSRGEAGGTAARPSSIRRKSLRRRQIDPTTCERDYSIEEVEFMRAMENYKRSSGRMFPTCSEILEVFRSLGYVRPVQLQAEACAVEASSAENS